MTYKPTIPPVDLPKDTANNRSILSAKFGVDMLSGANNLSSYDRAVRVGELMETGLFDLSTGGLLVPKDTLLTPEVQGNGEDFLINSSFTLWQRRQSTPSATGVQRAADGWYANGNGHPTLTQMLGMPVGSFTHSLFEPMGNPTRYMRMTWGAAPAQSTSRLAIVQQRVPVANRFVGREMVFSIFLRSNVARRIGMDATMVIAGVAEAAPPMTQRDITTEFTRVQFKFKLPSYLTAVAANTMVLELTIWCEAGTALVARSGPMPTAFTGSGWIDLMAGKLEEGDKATRFWTPDPVIDLIRAQQFYEKNFDIDVVPGTALDAGRLAMSHNAIPASTHYVGVQFSVRKYSTPAVTIYPATFAGGAAGNLAQDDGSIVGCTASSIGTMGYQLSWVNTAGRFGGWWYHTAECNP